MMSEIYVGLDELLQKRYADYPTRREPTWSALVTQLHAVAEALRLEVLRGENALKPSARAHETMTGLKDAPIFINGYYKSGTSLLLNLLDGHDECVVLPFESGYFTGARARQADLARFIRVDIALDTWIHKFINTGGKPPFWALGRVSVEEDPYRRFAAYLYDFAGRYPQQDMLSVVAMSYGAVRMDLGHTMMNRARLWVEKTPTTEFFVGDILRVYPQARFIHMLRDPRAILAARQKIARARGEAFYLASEVAEISRSFELVADYERDLGGGRYMILTYENLIREPQETMSLVAKFLGIDYMESLLKPTVGGLGATSNSAWGESRVEGMIHQDSLERWRESLGEDELRLIGEGCGESARRYGYALTGKPRPRRLF